MDDMSIVTAARSDQLNADDLVGRDVTITITGVKIRPGEDQPIAVSYDGSDKVWRPCKTTARLMKAAWGVDSKQYIGKSLTLYRDANVGWGGVKVGGIRISHMSDIDRDFTVALAESKQKRTPITVRVLKSASPAKQETVVQPAPPPAADAFIQDEARTAARRGTEAFKAWWAANPDWRTEATLIKGELQQFCAAADKAASEADNPFGLPPITPTQAEIDAAMDDAKRATEESE